MGLSSQAALPNSTLLIFIYCKLYLANWVDCFAGRAVFEGHFGVLDFREAHARKKLGEELSIEMRNS
jgi:hypothetical protein